MRFSRSFRSILTERALAVVKNEGKSEEKSRKHCSFYIRDCPYKASRKSLGCVKPYKDNL